MDTMIFAMLFLVGACVGSFCNVLIYRIPREEEFVRTPSHCMTCGHELKWYELIPVFSWLAQGGKCRACKKALSRQYPIVEAMNAKATELGLSDKTHFTNCIGLYDPDLHCTVEEMAIILKAALENDFCREVLTTITYQSVPTDHHPEGQVLSNLFSRRIQYQDTGAVTVSAAKTGYVEESGFCAASYGTTADGREYLCVTGKSTGTQQSIKDHAELYRTYCPEAVISETA